MVSASLKSRAPVPNFFWYRCVYTSIICSAVPKIRQYGAKNLGYRAHLFVRVNKPNANMADRSVGSRNESHESEISQSSMFCFDIASPGKSCFRVDLVCFISLCLRFAVFLNATRRDVNLPRTPLKLRENSGSMQFVETKERSSRWPREVKFVRYISHQKI